MSQLIPEEVIQEVLLRADIVDVIGDYVLLKKSGANYKGLCPFHGEKTPSFTVSPTKGLFHCFGCRASGNVVRFLMQHENMTFPEAVRWLAARYGVHMQELTTPRQHDTLDQLYALHQAATTFFHERLLRDPAAQAARTYCRQRHITSELAIHFGLGYAPQERDALCRAMQRQGFSRELVMQSGLGAQRESQEDLYDRFRHRLIFPIHDRLGRPIAFGGRLLDTGTASAHAPKYLNSPETPIFHKGRTLYGFHLAKQAIRQHERAIIVEGYTDVTACHRQGVAHVVGTLGTALTEHHVGLLKGCTKEVVLVFDSDAAGGAATERSIGLFLDAGIRVRIGELPEGEDPDSFLRHHTGTDFLQSTHAAVTFLSYLLARAKRFSDLRTPAGQADCVARLAPLLRKIDNEVERWGYTAHLAEQLGVPPEIISREMRPRGTPQSTIPRQALSSPAASPATSRPSTEYTLLQMLCHDLSLIELVRQHVTRDDFQDPELYEMYTWLLGLAAQGESSVSSQMLQQMVDAVQEQLFTQMLLAPVPPNPTERAKAVHDCMRKLRQRLAKSQRQRLIEHLRTVHSEVEEQQLLQEYNRLSKENPATHVSGRS